MRLTPEPAAGTSENVQLAWETLLRRPARGIPVSWVNFMQHAWIERLAGAAPGDYARDPERVYVACQAAIGACVLDQYIPCNPLEMGDLGYDKAGKTATQGAEQVVVDGMLIDSPEAVVEHMERFTFPALRQAIAAFDEDRRVQEIVANEAAVQAELGADILKTGYGFVTFPALDYSRYGYTNYFQAYALYPDVMERHFSLQADLSRLGNRAAARAYAEAHLPPLYRLDHDIADSRGTLVSLKSLDRLWLPHFARSLEPMLATDVVMIWHCDGNLMQMVPRLLDVGLAGFQGFQYEDGMDYEKICRMRSKKGEALIIFGGVSVTRTLPFGTPAGVKRELAWLVERGPATGLFLGASSSVAPGVPWENIRTFVEGLQYYRTHGRKA